jgi:hypothetical protein
MVHHPQNLTETPPPSIQYKGTLREYLSIRHDLMNKHEAKEELPEMLNDFFSTLASILVW